MKSPRLMCTVVISLLGALGIPVQLFAQHHHYKMIDIGTFGGPSSYFDDLTLSDRLGFAPSLFAFAPVLNNQGILAGWADTSMRDPNRKGHGAFCFSPDCFVSHAFQWQNGLKTDLGALPGGASSASLWINSNGLIVGMSQNGEIDALTGFPELRGVVWDSGQIIDLGTFGGNVSFASAVNDYGQVAGTALNAIPDQFSIYDLLLLRSGSSNGTQTRAFLWQNGVMQDLGTLGGPDASSALVNQRGQVAGYSYTNSTPNPTTGIPTFHPFLWEQGKGMKDLGGLGGTAVASVNGLNEQGEVVGGTLLPGDVQIHPFLWDGSKLIDLVAPPFGGNANGEASWINEAGEVVGLAGVPSSCPPHSLVGQMQHAFLWRNGVISDLGTIDGIPNSEADFINSNSQIVGITFDCNFAVISAFLWENGSMVDLNSLVSNNSSFQLFAASFISDLGEIAAFAQLPHADMHAVLLIPCDENHPNIEGCDYSLVYASAVAASASLVVGPQRPTTVRPTFLGTASPMIRSLRRRLMP